MRLLTQAGIDFRVQEYPVDENDLSGEHVAKLLGQPADQVFKTLVARSDKGSLFVFCIPVCEELDLKKAAAITRQKKIELIHVKELPALTGYIRGGCSPVGMKKKYPTYVDETALLWDEIYVSGGQRGVQVILDPAKLLSLIQGITADLIKTQG